MYVEGMDLRWRELRFDDGTIVHLLAVPWLIHTP